MTPEEHAAWQAIFTRRKARAIAWWAEGATNRPLPPAPASVPQAQLELGLLDGTKP